MLPKKRRVPRKLFQKAIKKSSFSSSSFFTVRYVKSNDVFLTRISIVISKKIYPKAVKRNLIKRRISAVLEGLENHLKNYFILIIFPKKGILELPFALLKQEVAVALQKIKAID